MKIKITKISKLDAYYEDRKDLIGREATLDEKSISVNDDGWTAGYVEVKGSKFPGRCKIYFAEFKYEELEVEVEAKPKPKPQMVEIRITDIDPRDAFYGDRDKLVGKIVKVSNAIIAVDSGLEWCSGKVWAKGFVEKNPDKELELHLLGYKFELPAKEDPLLKRIEKLEARLAKLEAKQKKRSVK
jgi:hypothetical protein